MKFSEHETDPLSGKFGLHLVGKSLDSISAFVFFKANYVCKCIYLFYRFRMMIFYIYQVFSNFNTKSIKC